MKLLIAVLLLLASLQALYAAPDLAVVVQREDKPIGVSTAKSKISVLNTTTLEQKVIYEAATTEFLSIDSKWSPDRSWIAIATYEEPGAVASAKFILYDVSKQVAHDAGTVCNNFFNDFFWAPDSKALYALVPSTGADNVKITQLVSINPSNREQTKLMPITASSIYFLPISLSPDGKKIVTTTDKQLVEYEVATGKIIPIDKLGEVEGDIRWIGDSGDYLVQSYKTGWSIKPKELTNKRRLATYLISKSTASEIHGMIDIDIMRHSVAMSPDGKCLAYGKANGEVILHELATGTEKQLAPPSEGDNTAKSDLRRFYPDGKSLAYTIGQTLHVVDVTTGKPILNGEPIVTIEPTSFRGNNIPMFITENKPGNRQLAYFNIQTGKMTVIADVVGRDDRCRWNKDQTILAVVLATFVPAPPAPQPVIARPSTALYLDKKPVAKQLVARRNDSESEDPQNMVSEKHLNFYDANGKKLASIDNPEGFWWTPDGKSVYYQKDGNLMMMSIATKEEKVLFDLGGIPVRSIVWAPEGK